jgi:hypothetical protein
MNEEDRKILEGTTFPEGTSADDLPTEEVALFSEVFREKRDRLLKETDWWAVADRTMTQAETDYRQALRDVPQQDGFPVNITWPTKPE